MNDFYLKVANSQLGKNFLEALNLPTPPELYRTPETPLSIPVGRVLVSASKNNLGYSHIVKALDHDSVKLFTPHVKEEYVHLFNNQTRVKLKNTIQTQRFDTQTVPRFRFVVFDASGFEKSEDLKALYAFFQPIIKGLKKNAKIIIVGRHLSNTSTPAQAALASGLEGFVKSLAKEIGYKGATCNLIQLGPGAEKNLTTALYFFLSTKSAFVSGQTLHLTKSSVRYQRIDWAKPLAGKTALVTGAAQGIGEQTARMLARDGATVVCLDIPANKAAIVNLANEIGGHPLAMDLSETDAPKQIVNTLSGQLGLIDIVIHNAGITRDKTLAKMPEHFWDQAIDINLNKPLEINKLLLDKQVLNKNARIVCISSISGIAGNFGQSNYAFSKAGVAGYTGAFSQQLDKGITINAIAPGFIETKMTSKIPFMTREIGRRTNSLSQGGLPSDVAEAICFFCHPASQSLNGNVLRVCGQSLLGR